MWVLSQLKGPWRSAFNALQCYLLRIHGRGGLVLQSMGLAENPDTDLRVRYNDTDKWDVLSDDATADSLAQELHWNHYSHCQDQVPPGLR